MGDGKRDGAGSRNKPGPMLPYPKMTNKDMDSAANGSKMAVKKAGRNGGEEVTHPQFYKSGMRVGKKQAVFPD
jgi:hypothetical protein